MSIIKQSQLEEVKADVVLDTRYYDCPIPILKTKQAAKKLKPGQILKILSKDPWFREDLPYWADKEGYRYLGSHPGQKCIHFYLKKQ